MDFLERAVEQWTDIVPEHDLFPFLTTGRILRMASIITHASEKRLAQSGVNRGEFNLLCVMRRSGKTCRASELSALTESSGAAITKRLERLSDAGFVERQELPRDRRVVLVNLTEQGKEFVDDVFPMMLLTENAYLDVLSEDEHAALAKILEKLLAVLDPADY